MGYKTFTCSVSKQCGGCEWLAVPYPIQLRRKQESLDELFGDLFQRAKIQPEPIIGMDDPQAYRHKAATPFAPGKKRTIRSGFYRKGTHQITRCPHCLVEAPGIRELLDQVAHVFERFKIAAYNEDTGRGLVRHALVRAAYGSDALMLTIVTNGDTIPQEKLVVNALRALDKRIVLIAQNINNKRTNAILGHKTRVLYGPERLRDKLLDCTFEISPTAFYQTNPRQTEVLYSCAIEYAQVKPGDLIMDAYCGSGTIGLCVISQVPDTYLVGVERSEESVKDARRNARINELEDRATFIAQDATAYLKECAKREGQANTFSTAHARATSETPDVLIMDPPRAGSTPAFMKSVAALGIPRVVYVSCNPVTLRRDLDVFLELGYELERFGAVDMFPHTKHVECVCLLERTR